MIKARDGREIILIGLIILPIIRGILIPEWISIPRLGGVENWPILELEARLLPAVFVLLLSVNIREFLAKEELSIKLLKRCVLILLGIYLLTSGYFAARLYINYSKSDLGRYFLPPHSNYYFLNIKEYIWPYGLHLAAGLGAAGVFGILHLITNGRAVEKNEVLLGLFVGLVFGISNTLYILMGAFAMAFIWMLAGVVRTKKSGLIRVTPFIFFISYIILAIGL